MNKILSALFLLMIGIFVIGCSSKVESIGYYGDKKVITQIDMKELSGKDINVIRNWIQKETSKKFLMGNQVYTFALYNNQLVGTYSDNNSKESPLQLIKKIDDYWVLNAQVYINNYLECRKEAKKLFIEMKNAKFNKLKVNVVAGNLSPTIRDYILKDMKTVENPEINEINIDELFSGIADKYFRDEYILSTEKIINYMINSEKFSPATIYFLNGSKILTLKDFRNGTIDIDITNSKIELIKPNQVFENEDLKITVSNSNAGNISIQFLYYENKTDKFINIKTTSLYLGENVYQGPQISTVLSPYGETKSSVDYLGRAYRLDRDIPHSVRVKVMDLKEIAINFGYAVKYEIEGKEKTLLRTSILTYKDFNK